MYAHTSSYTSGTSNAQSSYPATVTTGPKTRVAPQESTLVHNNESKSWIQWALDQLHAISKLEPNWDSYDGNPPSAPAVVATSDLLQTVHQLFGKLDHEQSQPQVIAPRADGGVQIEWGTGPIEIAVHANPSGTLGYLYIDRQGNTPKYEAVQIASQEKILQLIATVVFSGLR